MAILRATARVLTVCLLLFVAELTGGQSAAVVVAVVEVAVDRLSGITAEIAPTSQDFSTHYCVATTRDCDQTTTVS